MSTPNILFITDDQLRWDFYDNRTVPTLIGNIQYDDFRSLTTAQMAAAVREVLEECHGRRFILSPSAGPFDPVPPARLAENYHAMLRTAWDYGPWEIGDR